MPAIDYNAIIQDAWKTYDASREIERIIDISAKVSTNHVYRITLRDRNFVVAKLSFFGTFEHFLEDHTIINTLSNNLPSPFEGFLARALMKGNTLFVHRYKSDVIDAWVVFYRPVKIKLKPPKRFTEDEIAKMGQQMALFHQACDTVKNTLPSSSKSMKTDINDLLETLDHHEANQQFPHHKQLIKDQCELFLKNYENLGASALESTPVFVDWNIGNFSITPTFRLFSRWDYDWFRMSTRMLDFYFFSRISSDIGDRTVFTYNIDVLMEPRFLFFLEAYHKLYPITEQEILFLKEAYRFFILTYVVKYGKFFFNEVFANKLQKEAFEKHLPSVDKKFNPKQLLEVIK